ncbi:lysozyme [Vibrio ziniensis]|uniref:Lysozyme n=1 Tax=Vibrio ziniensis TaxID=2711221 RepID=A0A6G7CH63_9VIBR|nr:lysozyme [Vibrio ziniensis]QIH41442.1 lysozyme [Vibrio ziniensis]QNR59183.1 lysozyme [Vibrio ziniensis]
MNKISLNIRSLSAAGASAFVMAMALIVPFEGKEFKPYYDVAGILTVCHGHTGSDIIEDKTYNESECVQLLEQDLATVKQNLDPLIKHPIPEATRAALYSFTFNVGVGAMSRSTLLMKLNSGDTKAACLELHRWVYAGGQKWKGLITRRQIEEEICNLQLSSS